MKITLRIAVIAFFLVLSVDAANAQIATKLRRPCSSSTTPATVEIQRDGDIDIVPCSGRSFLVNGSSVTGTSTTAAATISDNAIVRGDGGSRGVQSSLVSISDTGDLTAGSGSIFVSATAGRYIGFGDNNTAFSKDTGDFEIRTYLAAAPFNTLGSSGIMLRNNGQFNWASGTDPQYASVAQDTGFARYSAGVIRATNGGTAIRALIGGGGAVASAAALPLPTGRIFHVTGTTNITSITSTNFASGVCVTLIFDGVLTFTDGGNLVLAGNFVTTADDTISLCYDGTNWYETGRSVN